MRLSHLVVLLIGITTTLAHKNHHNHHHHHHAHSAMSSSGEVESESVRRETLAQRAFAIVRVKGEGYLLMKTVKKEKSEHLQLPGGRIDPGDFDALNLTRKVQNLTESEMLSVAERALFRELREETGLDFGQLVEDSSEEGSPRLYYLKNVSDHVAERSHRKKRLRRYGFVKGTHFPRKFYFVLNLKKGDIDLTNITLSHEHTGFVLERNIHKAIRATRPHSGGDSAEALKIYWEEQHDVVQVSE